MKMYQIEKHSKLMTNLHQSTMKKTKFKKIIASKKMKIVRKL